jgi:hypothetical protein
VLLHDGPSAILARGATTGNALARSPLSEIVRFDPSIRKTPHAAPDVQVKPTARGE